MLLALLKQGMCFHKRFIQWIVADQAVVKDKVNIFATVKLDTTLSNGLSVKQLAAYTQY